MGFEFQVLPEKVFAVHRWHKSSDSKKKLSGIVKASVGRAYEEFLSDVMRRYKGHGGRRRVNGVNAGRVGGRGGDPATLAAGLQSFMHFL